MSQLMNINQNLLDGALAGPSMNLLSARKAATGSSAVPPGRLSSRQRKSSALIKRCILAAGGLLFATATVSVAASILFSIVAK